ncbi:hypothetical protein KUTeg_019057 [Tegillarca granosa]|uniref:Uncharacterized protein n=1 Tax=Tegillarca granosa TaxID=220873 RepID=A0ABQ9EBE3_TEGGR|nr:hypothetical protein KUTeg_019057 [Tegillarca granosa]
MDKYFSLIYVTSTTSTSSDTGYNKHIPQVLLVESGSYDSSPPFVHSNFGNSHIAPVLLIEYETVYPEVNIAGNLILDWTSDHNRILY